MKLEGEGKLLRIFVGESDKADGHMLYEMLVRRAREAGLAGTTVLRGIEGFGAKSRIHTAKILRLSEDLPIVVEIVDTEEKIQAFFADGRRAVPARWRRRTGHVGEGGGHPVQSGRLNGEKPPR